MRPDGKKDVPLRRVSRPGGLDDAIISERFVDHLFNHPKDRRRAEFVEFVIPALRDPGEVWGRWEEIGGRPVWREFSLAVFPEANNTVVVLRDLPKLGMFAWTARPVSEPGPGGKRNQQTAEGEIDLPQTGVERMIWWGGCHPWRRLSDASPALIPDKPTVATRPGEVNRQHCSQGENNGCQDRIS